MGCRKILVLCVGVAAAIAIAPRASASSILFQTPNGSVTEADNGTNFPVDASVLFTFGTNQVTVTITNLEADTFFDSQNVAGVTFQLFNSATPITSSSGTSSTTANVVNLGGTGSTAGSTNNIVENVTPNPMSTSVQWVLQNLATNGGSFGQSNASGSGSDAALGTNAFIFATSAPGSGWDGTNAIVGSGSFDGVNPIGSCPGATGSSVGNCNSGNPIAAAYGSNYPQATEQMIYNSVTFTLNITGILPTTTVGQVGFILGPDGPDADDFILAQQVQTTPEPSSLLLGASGLFAIAGIRAWRARTMRLNALSPAIAGQMEYAAGIVEARGASVEPSRWGSWINRRKRASSADSHQAGS